MAADDRQDLHADTRAIVAGRGTLQPGGPLNVPVHLASNFHAGGDVAYAREGNPSWTALEEAVGALEGGSAVAFASGMAAVSAVLEDLAVGAAVVAPLDAYTGTRVWIAEAHERRRLAARFVDITDTAAVAAACDGADLVWVESPTNPSMGIADLSAIAAAARDAGAALVVDNTFATPLLQQPLEFGADVVVHSATKFIAGHSDVLGGVAITRDAQRLERLRGRRTLLGAVPGPVEAYLVLRGLRTLPVRLARAQASAGELAARLNAHPKVDLVRYPGLPSDPGHVLAAEQMQGFGAVLSFELADAAAAERVCAATDVIVHATSLGGIETTMERRRRHEHEDHVPEGLVRLSVGCEHVDDLWADLAAALEQA